MCGRYASFRQAQDLADAFAVHGLIQGVLLGEPVTDLPPSWNVAPTDLVRIVVDRAQETLVPAAPSGPPTGPARPSLQRSLRLARWGLVPSWAKDPSGGARMINARAETVAEKPAFRKALAARRCLVPAEGYYEWLAPEPGARRGPKQPVFIHPADGGVLALAGLYEFWRDPSRAPDDPERWLTTTTIVTSAASGDLAEIHERRPVGLRPEHWDDWLDPGAGADVALAVLASEPPEMSHHLVSTAVNRVGTQGIELVEPLDR
jgi:putative SOS response-associated peptidase YedK